MAPTLQKHCFDRAISDCRCGDHKAHLLARCCYWIRNEIHHCSAAKHLICSSFEIVKETMANSGSKISVGLESVCSAH